MITGAIVGREELIARLAGGGTVIRQRINTEVQKLGFELERRVKSDKLSGQVLNVVTGLLRSSISQGGPQSVSKFETSDEGATYTVGTAVKYAAVHEYGFDGLVTVRPYVRHTYKVSYKPLPGDTRAGSYTGQFMKRVRGEVTGYAYVNGFIRHMKMPERSYLRSTLGEMQSFIVERLRVAAGEGAQMVLK